MITILHRTLPVLAGVTALVTSIFVFAGGPLPAPKGEVILTFEGQISNTNAPGGRAEWDLAMLKDLGVTTFITRTPWMEGEPVFEGVLVRDVLKAIGAKGANALASALDGYSNEVPLQDFSDYDVIFAYSINGKMLVKEGKGPLWIMYPFDAHPGIDIDDKSAHAVWQLARISVQ